METERISESPSFDGALRTVTERMIGGAIRVHSSIGLEFIESIYEAALALEFERQHIRFARQHPVRGLYEGEVVGIHRLDLLVDHSVIVELKAKKDFSK